MNRTGTDYILSRGTKELGIGQRPQGPENFSGQGVTTEEPFFSVKGESFV